MKYSESIQSISKALLAIQKEIKNIKQTAENPFYHSSYAPLNDILDIVRPVCNKHGVTILQDITGDDSGIVISTMLLHESGEWISQEGIILPKEKNTAQGTGSAVTYGRRYALSAMLGIASEEDDDGNANNKNEGQIKKNWLDYNVVDNELKQCNTKQEVINYCNILNDEYPNMSDKQKAEVKKKAANRVNEIEKTSKKVQEEFQGKLVDDPFDDSQIQY